MAARRKAPLIAPVFKDDASRTFCLSSGKGQPGCCNSDCRRSSSAMRNASIGPRQAILSLQ
jgi:hypothetical protein